MKKKAWRFVLGFTAVLILASYGSAAQARTRKVPKNYATIQEAIVAANNGDTVLVSAGTYPEKINFLGKAITVISEDGPAATIITRPNPDGDYLSLVTFDRGETTLSVLSGFTITGAYTRTGGGITCRDSSPTITNCIISDNEALFNPAGGGLYLDNSHPVITDCIISGNRAPHGDGGGMFLIDSSPTFINCTFSGNSSGTSGGAMSSWSGDPKLIDCSFTGNVSGWNGGAIYFHYTTPSCEITNCVFSGNSANNGGGAIYFTQSGPTITNCVFNDNWTTGGAGGALAVYSSTWPTIINSTIADNTAATVGGAIDIDGTPGYPGGAYVVNSILYGNSPDEISPGNPDVTFSNVQGGYPGAGNIDVLPLFKADDCGRTNYALDPSVPEAGIDRGTPNGAPEGDLCFVSARDASPDMGAYEFQSNCNNDCVCDPGEDCVTCPNDCAGQQCGNPLRLFCCGDGTVDGPEGDGVICDGNF